MCVCWVACPRNVTQVKLIDGVVQVLVSSLIFSLLLCLLLGGGVDDSHYNWILSVSPFGSISFCFRHFQAVVLGACTFRTVLSSSLVDPFVAAKTFLLSLLTCVVLSSLMLA